VLINNLYEVVPSDVKGWPEFIVYVRDYEELTKLKGEDYL
jgi:hypothetical protein